MKLRSRFFYVLAGLGLLASRADADFFGIGVNVKGNSLSQTAGIVPPDTDGSIGLNHYVEFTNGSFAVYDKATGALVGSRISDTSFWNNAGISSAVTSPGVTDTRIVFDAASQHWFASEVTKSNTGNQVLIARSNTADPTQGFKAVNFTANSGFGDFPTIGLNATGIFIATNNFTSDSSTANFTGVSVTVIPKSDLLLATPTAANRTTFTDPYSSTTGTTLGIALQPVVDTGGFSAQGSILARSGANNSSLDQTTIFNPGSTTPTISTAVVNVQTYNEPANARQPDGSRVISANDSTLSAIVYRVGDFLYTAHDTLLNDHDAIRWTKINATTHAVVQEGTLADSNYDFIFPSIAANAFGDVVIGFTRTGAGADGFASSAAFIGSTTNHDPTNGTITFEASPHLLMAGAANYHAQDPSNKTGDERWGDYSSTTLDPTNPYSFWTAQEYTDATNSWSTQITQILVTVPEPGSMALLTIGVSLVVGLAWRGDLTRRRASNRHTTP